LRDCRRHVNVTYQTRTGFHGIHGLDNCDRPGVDSVIIIAMNILNQPWNVVYFFGFVAYLSIRSVYARRTKVEVKIHRQVDWLEKSLLLLVIPGLRKCHLEQRLAPSCNNAPPVRSYYHVTKQDVLDEQEIRGIREWGPPCRRRVTTERILPR
jgi:hypothetical protein